MSRNVMSKNIVLAELSDEALEQVVGGLIPVDPPIIPIDPPMIPVDPPVHPHPVKDPFPHRFHGGPVPIVHPVILEG